MTSSPDNRVWQRLFIQLNQLLVLSSTGLLIPLFHPRKYSQYARTALQRPLPRADLPAMPVQRPRLLSVTRHPPRRQNSRCYPTVARPSAIDARSTPAYCRSTKDACFFRCRGFAAACITRSCQHGSTRCRRCARQYERAPLPVPLANHGTGGRPAVTTG